MEPPDKKNEGSGDAEHELTMANNADVISLKRLLEEFMGQKHISYSIDCINFTFTVLVNILQLWKTCDMCFFDEYPIWRMNDNPICSGSGHDFYYFFLGIAHFYFLAEFIIRTTVAKVPV